MFDYSQSLKYVSYTCRSGDGLEDEVRYHRIDSLFAYGPLKK